MFKPSLGTFRTITQGKSWLEIMCLNQTLRPNRHTHRTSDTLLEVGPPLGYLPLKERSWYCSTVKQKREQYRSSLAILKVSSTMENEVDFRPFSLLAGFLAPLVKEEDICRRAVSFAKWCASLRASLQTYEQGQITSMSLRGASC